MANAEMPREPSRTAVVFRVHRKKLRGELRERSANGRRAPRGVLVKVEPQLIRAAFARGFVGLAIENSLAHWKLNVHFHIRFHRRPSMAFACASSPSALAS